MRSFQSATHVPDLYPDSRRRSTRAPGIDRRIELWVVIHLELAVEFEAAFAGMDLCPEDVEATGKIVTLFGKKCEPVTVFLAVRLGCRGALRFFGGVVDLELKDGEPVEDEAGRLRVKRSGGGLLAGGGEQHAVERFDEVVAALIETVDAVLHVRDVGLGCERVASFIFFVPEIEVGVMVSLDELEEELRSCGGRRISDRNWPDGTRRGRLLWRGRVLMPAKGGLVVQADDLFGVEHMVRS
jgi:hypothetical protein